MAENQYRNAAGTVLSWFVLPPLLFGCSGSLSLSSAADVDAERPRVCASPTAAFHADTFDWEPAARTHFETLASNQVVVARVADCGWILLEGCSVRSKYQYRSVPLQRERAAGEATAGISLGTSEASPNVSRSSEQLRDVAVAGVFELPRMPAPAELEGHCDGATHVVTRYATGAFRAITHVSRAGGLRIPHAGAAEAADQHSMMRQAGNPDACAERADSREPPVDCAASIQLELVPFGQFETSPVVTERNASSTEPVAADACAAGDAAVCHEQCARGISSSCTAMGVLCARGNMAACGASAQLPLDVWSAWIATRR